MYLCLCHNITDKQFQEMIQKTGSTQAAVNKIGLGESCGICLTQALENGQTKLPSEVKTTRQAFPSLKNTAK